jgi:hypothetical protein
MIGPVTSPLLVQFAFALASGAGKKANVFDYGPYATEDLEIAPFAILRGTDIRSIFWAACALWILPEAIAGIVKRSRDSSRARDKGSLGLIVVLWWLGIALDFAFSFFLPQTAIAWERNQVFFVGIGLMLAGRSNRMPALSSTCTPCTTLRESSVRAMPSEGSSTWQHGAEAVITLHTIATPLESRLKTVTRSLQNFFG